MQSRLSPSHLPLDSKGLATVSRSAAQGNQPGFQGTIASACDLGIRIDNFIAMTRLARMSDAGVARFLDAWEALGPPEQQARGAADTICEQIGFASIELLRIVADVTCRIGMHQAQMIAALAHPRVVEKTIERALTDEGIADRMALHKAMGFLPTPKGSQTIISIMQNAQANTAVQTVAAPRPEHTIRRLADRFNEVRAKMDGGKKDDVR